MSSKNIIPLSTSFPPDRIAFFEKPTVKAGLHLEQQKLGRIPEDGQLSLFDEFKEIADKEKTTIETDTAGIDLTVSQTKALFAIQRILSSTNYTGHDQIKINSHMLNGQEKPYIAPKIRFRTPEYLDAYGVTKKETARGFMEYNPHEREEALSALWELNDIQHNIIYKRKYYNDKGEEKEDRVIARMSLIKVLKGYRGLSIREADLLDNGGEVTNKLEYEIVPSLVMIDQIDTYFVLKHRTYLEDIKKVTKKTSKYYDSFINYLYTTAELKRRAKEKGSPIIKIGYKELAYKLRMDSLIKSRQDKRIKGILKECYTIAFTLGYLKEEVKTVRGQTKDIELIILNPDKFYKPAEKGID